MVATFASCSNEEAINNDGATPMTVKVNNNIPASRALVTGEVLPAKSTIGVMVVDDSGEKYDGNTYINIPYYSENGTEWSVKTGSTAPLLSLPEGTAYAYYPYSDKTTDFTQISVETESQTDYMYATPVAGLDYNNSEASFILNHMLANFNVKVVKGAYVGKGFISSISVEGDGIATDGVFNAVQDTPGYESFEGVGEPVGGTMDTEPFGTSHDYMVVPVGISAPVSFRVVVDDKEFVGTTSAISVKEGYVYSYTLTINEDMNLVCSYNGVKEWKETETENKDMDTAGDFSVNITGDISDLAMNSIMEDDGTIKVTVVPCDKNDVRLMNVVCQGSATVNKSGDLYDGGLVMTISDLQSDVVIDFKYVTVGMSGDIDGLTLNKTVTGMNSMTVTIENSKNTSIEVNGTATIEKNFDDINNCWIIELTEIQSDVDIQVTVEVFEFTITYTGNPTPFNIEENISYKDQSATIIIIPKYAASFANCFVTGDAEYNIILPDFNNSSDFTTYIYLTNINSDIEIRILPDSPGGSN